MRVRLRNKEVERSPLGFAELEKSLPTEKEIPVTKDNKLFYITIGLLSGDIILQLVQLALKLL